MSEICRVKLLRFRAKAPTRAYPGDTCFDLYAVEPLVIQRSDTVVVPLGIAIELPAGYGAQVRPRSSQSKRGVLVSLGTVDGPFRGELGATITNLSREPYEIEAGMRVAQLAIEQVPDFQMVEVLELSETVRGDAGWGSSGK